MLGLLQDKPLLAFVQQLHRQVFCDLRHQFVEHPFGAIARGRRRVGRLPRHVQRLLPAGQQKVCATELVITKPARRLFDPSAGHFDPLTHLLLGFEKDAAEALEPFALPADEDRVRAVLVEALLPKGPLHLSGCLAKSREAIRTGRRIIHGNQSST